jgi:hypothetical protein
MNLGRPAEARRYAAKAVELAREMVRADPKDGTALHDLGVSLGRLGMIDPAPGNDASALRTHGGTAHAPGGTNAAGVVIAAGGFDPYISLFVGAGSTATFLASNDDGGRGPASPDPVCADSRLDFTVLSAGTYTLALTLPNNFSFAENYGSGTLGDGFIGLQGDYYDAASGTVRSSNYAVDITSRGFGSDPSPVPEPGSLSLLATGVFMATLRLTRAARESDLLGARAIVNALMYGSRSSPELLPWSRVEAPRSSTI